MARRNECDGCGLAACDLPDGVDPDLIFEVNNDNGRTYCQTCQLPEGTSHSIHSSQWMQVVSVPSGSWLHGELNNRICYAETEATPRPGR